MPLQRESETQGEREEAVKITERINTEDGAEEAERLKRIRSVSEQSRARAAAAAAVKYL